MAIEKIAGKVSPVPKGAYNAQTTYSRLDIVSYGGKSWMAKRTVTNVTPTEGDDWMMFVDVSNKADKATTLAGYGITDGATKTELATKANQSDVTKLTTDVGSLSDTIVDSADWLNGHNLSQGICNKSVSENGAFAYVGNTNYLAFSENKTKCKPNTIYTASSSFNNSNNYYYVAEWDARGTFKGRRYISKTFTTLTDAVEFFVYVYNPEKIFNITSDSWGMLNEGNTALPYTPPSKSNVDLTREAQDLEASNYLGWTTPTELIEQGLYNYVSGDVCHQRVGRVDLGELTWNYTSTSTYFNTASDIPNKKYGVTNIYTNAYPISKIESVTTQEDKTIKGNNANAQIYLKDSAYNTNSGGLKTSLKGKYLYYELATEQTVSTQLFDEIATLKPSRYITSGLSYTKCIYASGGYFKVGNVVFVNIRVTASSDATSSDTMVVRGFPPYTNISDMNMVNVNVTRVDGTKDNSYGYIVRDGNLSIEKPTASASYIISATYLAN